MNTSDKNRLNQVEVPDRGPAGKYGDSTRGVGDMIDTAIGDNNNGFTPSSGTLTVTGAITATTTVTGADITCTDDLTTADLFVTGDVTLGTSKTIALTTSAIFKDAVGGNTLFTVTDSGTTGDVSATGKVSSQYIVLSTGPGRIDLAGGAPAMIFVGGAGNEMARFADDGTTGHLVVTGSGSTHKLGGSTATLGGVITVDTTAVGNVDTGADDLISYTLPASTLVTTGRGLRITAWGTGANNADAKTVTLEFGGQTIMTQALTASQVNNWRITALVFRTGASTQDIFAEFIQTGTTVVHKQTITAGTQTETGTIVIKCTGDGVTTNNIVQEGLLVEAL